MKKMGFWEQGFSEQIRCNLAYAGAVMICTWLYTGYLHWKFSLTLQKNKNLSKVDVVSKVLLNQIIQTCVFISLGSYLDEQQSIKVLSEEETNRIKNGMVVVGRVILAMVLIDTWQYWMHRLAHRWKWAFQKIHIVHHYFVIPEPVGGFYNHIVESLIMDGGSFAFAQILSGMSNETAAMLGLFANLKTIHDHLGIDSPRDDWMTLWSYVSDNNADYHRKHHQQQKGNFQQPFFTFWDRFCGTNLL